MKKATKRICSLAMACMMMAGGAALPAQMIHAAETESAVTEECIVIAKNANNRKKIALKYSDEETPASVQDDGMLFLTLTEQEKQELEMQTGVQIEEDDTVTASAKKNEDTEEKVFSIAPKKQWNLNMVSALGKKANISASDLSKIKVAVLDSGVSFTTDVHVAKSINLVPGEEEVLPFYEDVTGHGTSVAGIIGAANNDEGTTGVNPSATLYSVRVLDDANQAPVSRVIEGIYWCIDNDVNIINMSFGMDSYNEALHTAIQAAHDAGILIVAAAGNGEQVQYPAAFPEVLSVGAVDAQGKGVYKNANNNAIDITAPGKEIPGVGFLDGILEVEGSSMAAPHVAAAASVLWAKNPDKSADFIRNLLEKSGRKTPHTATADVLDLDYALSNYDVAEKTANASDDVTIPENTQEVQTFDKETLNASWKTDRHGDVIVVYGQNHTGLPTSMVKYVKYGIKAVDYEKSLKPIPAGAKADDTSLFECLHGYSSFVCNTVYLAELAKETEITGDWAKSIENVKYPVENSEHINETGNIKSSKNIPLVLLGFDTPTNWSNMLSNKNIIGSGTEESYDDLTPAKRAYFLLGLSTHNAMDVFAHRTCIKVGDEWVSVKSVYGDGDDETVVNLRWKVAKQVAYEILDRYVSNKEITADVFLEDTYNTIEFKVMRFKTYYDYCSTTLYNQNKEWIDARSTMDPVT